MKTIGNRMKFNYEDRYRIKLTRRTPVIMRLDGRAFHTLTRGCDRPFDEKFNQSMVNVTKAICAEFQGVKFAYTQSDEMSFLLTDFDTLQTDAPFDYNVQKLCSIAAGYASVKFTGEYKKIGIFDCRVFNIPKEEVCNYFIWRQKDWARNSIQMLVQAFFSHNQLHKKSTAQMHEMLYAEKGINWADLAPKWKNGASVSRDESEWVVAGDKIFTEDRSIIEQHLYIEEKGV